MSKLWRYLSKKSPSIARLNSFGSSFGRRGETTDSDSSFLSFESPECVKSTAASNKNNCGLSTSTSSAMVKIPDFGKLVEEYFAQANESTWPSTGGIYSTLHRRNGSNGVEIFEEIKETGDYAGSGGVGRLNSTTGGDDSSRGNYDSVKGVSQVLSDINDVLDRRKSNHETLRILSPNRDSSSIGLQQNSSQIVAQVLSRLLFHMHCRLSDCSICLSSLGSYGKDLSDGGVAIEIERNKDSTEKNHIISLQVLQLPPSQESLDENAPPKEVSYLPCGHKFCRVCFDEVVVNRAEELYGDVANAPNKMRIRCPLCRKKVKCTNVVNIS